MTAYVSDETVRLGAFESVLARSGGAVVAADVGRASVLYESGELVEREVSPLARSNQNTFMSQRSVVRAGQMVSAAYAGRLNDDGLARVGSRVRAGDALVGRRSARGADGRRGASHGSVDDPLLRRSRGTLRLARR